MIFSAAAEVLDVLQSTLSAHLRAWPGEMLLDVAGSAPTHALSSLHWVFASQLISEGWAELPAWWAVMCWAILSSHWVSPAPHIVNGSGLEIEKFTRV